MSIPIAEFWGTNYYNNLPLTDNMIAIAEERLKVRLPSSYIALLRLQNGGYTRQPFAYPRKPRTKLLTECREIDGLNGIVPDGDVMSGGIHNILLTEYMTKEWKLPPRQVLLDGDGHTWVSLDYRRGDIPCVAWLDAEFESESMIAKTFDAFLEGLRPASEFVLP